MKKKYIYMNMVFLITLIVYISAMFGKPEQIYDNNNMETIAVVRESVRLAKQNGGKVLILGDFCHKETDRKKLEPTWY